MRVFQEAGGDARKTIMGHLESESSFKVPYSKQNVNYVHYFRNTAIR